MKKLSLLLLCLSLNLMPQEKKLYKIRTIAFYNLENMFDTIDNPLKKDELSPIMSLKHSKSKVYKDRIKHLSKVISQIGKKKTKTAPALLGVAEVENDKVLNDLIHSKRLEGINYQYIWFDSPDNRGIDVALLYQPKYFKPTHYEVWNPNIFIDNIKIHTRDILWVKGLLDDEEVNIIVNHWPSRRGGEEESRPYREKSAYRVTQIIEQIRKNDNYAKIIIMGDFNDDPTSSSIKEILKAKKKIKNLKDDELYNPYEKLFSKGLNTLVYRDNVNLFDQIILSKPLLTDNKNKDYSTYKILSANIFNKNYLIDHKDRFKGYPYRSFSNGHYTGGYSDHFPVYIYLIKEHH